MASTPSIVSFDSSSLINYYNAKINVAVNNASRGATATPSANSSSSSAASGGAPPWQTSTKQSQEAQDAQTLSVSNFFQNNTQLTSVGNSKSGQDNQNLFSLYQAVTLLSNLANMSTRDGMTSGQLTGFNTRFQSGLAQVQSFLKSTDFNNFTLQAATPGATATSAVSIPFAPMQYAGGTIATGDAIKDPLSGVSTSDDFTVSVKKGSATTAIDINLANVQGPLTADNIVSYVNQQISGAGFSTRFSRVITSGTIDDPDTLKYGIAISDVPSETVTLSSAAATPSLYIAGNVGSATGSINASTGTETAADQSGRLLKLSNLDSAPTSEFSQNISTKTGITTAAATAVDSNGNVYVVGNTTGSFGNQLNQGSQDVYLTKYDSAGNVQWTRLLGSAATASGYSLAVDPTGGVVVSGSTTDNLIQTGIADGKADSFVSKYTSDGDQSWTQQVPALSANQAQAVTVDSSGNVYIGGQVTGLIGSGQTNNGSADGYVAKLDKTGKFVFKQQLGTSGADQVSQMATTSDGGLVVASVQNGHAILSKYAGGDATTTPVWQVDLGDLQAGGAISGIAVSGDQIYLSGTTANTSLNAGGAATIANASTGGSDAFVFSLTDNGTSAAPETTSYVGTSAKDTGGALTVGADGAVYLTGTTTGTFAGQSRNVANTNNMFVAALNTDGSVKWTQQYGGADGVSTGAGIAIDTQGSSVLDALGLPHGKITVPQPFALSANTTLREGDSFEIDVAGDAARKITIRIAKGETLQSLATKINGEMAFVGSAKVGYAHGGETLQISVNAGVTATLAPGSEGFDALGRLGITAGVLSKGAAKGSSSTATSSGTQVYGLGLVGTLDLSNQSNAKMAALTMKTVLSSIQNAYNKSNAPASSTAGTTAASSSSGTAPSYLTSQIASYSAALAMFGGGTSA